MNAHFKILILKKIDSMESINRHTFKTSSIKSIDEPGDLMPGK